MGKELIPEWTDVEYIHIMAECGQTSDRGDGQPVVKQLFMLVGKYAH